jgi:hypothetical protein
MSSPMPTGNQPARLASLPLNNTSPRRLSRRVLLVRECECVPGRLLLRASRDIVCDCDGPSLFFLFWCLNCVGAVALFVIQLRLVRTMITKVDGSTGCTVSHSWI